MVSTAMPGNGATDRLTRFLARPYRAKLTASATAIHGAELPETPSTTTASAPRPTATHWAGRRRSCSRPTPSSTVTSGLR